MRNELQEAVDRLAENLRDAEETINDRTAHSMVQDEARKNIPAFNTALTALRDAMKRQPDSDTGLLPCGCGGKAKIWLSDFSRVTYLITDYEVGCTECAMTTGWVRGKQENAVKVWNMAMGYKEQ